MNLVIVVLLIILILVLIMILTELTELRKLLMVLLHTEGEALEKDPSELNKENTEETEHS